MDQPMDVTEIDVGNEDDFSVQLKNLKVMNLNYPYIHVLFIFGFKVLGRDAYPDTTFDKKNPGTRSDL